MNFNIAFFSDINDSRIEMGQRLPCDKIIENNNFQLEYIWNPVSENKDQYNGKFPLRHETANLIHATRRIDYIKASQPSFRKELIRTTRINFPKYDSRETYIPANAFKFRMGCNKHVDRPSDGISTEEGGFARHVDPYMTITTRDYVPLKHSQPDNITFWNWNSTAFKEATTPNGDRTTSRAMLPSSKLSLKSFSQTEMSANYKGLPQKIIDTLPISLKSVVLEPTEKMDHLSEYSNYGRNVNCAKLFRQRKYE